MIAGVCTTFNEADIVRTTVLHMLGEGVDHLYFADASTDETPYIIKEAGGDQVTVIRDDELYHFQPKWINAMATHAHDDGHEWILPFDADEFWYANGLGTIREALDGLDDRKLHVRAFQHRDWDYVEREYRSLGKVAFRWEPGCQVTNGNHDVYLPANPGQGRIGVLELRELQFRSFDHMARKCRERVDRLDPSLPWTEGTHQRELAVLSEEQLRLEWARRMAVACRYSPIPLKVSGVR